MLTVVESSETERRVDDYDIRRDQKEVDIGRHPDCKVAVKDKRASSRHVRIYRDDAFHFFIECLSGNGAWCNDHHMNKGDTRALQHGDAISIVVHHAGKTAGQKPFAAYIFRLTDHQSDPAAAAAAAAGEASSCLAAPAAESSIAGGGGTPAPQPTNAPEPGGGGSSSRSGSSRLVSEQWVGDHWDMRTLLGSGNFSEVRLGVQVKKPGSEKCAVKVIDKKRFVQFQSKRESQLSLQSEAAILMRMDNPGIIRFFDWFETEEKLFIAMEFLSGGDLLQYILENGCFTENVARRLFKQIAGAVSYLHEKNIVHRDLKPENILLTSKSVDDMKPKLADFGLARMNMKTKDCKTFCGTPHYFAPEVIHTFRDRDAGQPGGYGKQADMWSLGVILYIMLSGIPPFEEEGLYEQILEGKYEFDVHEWNQVSPEAKELVRQLMTVNPKGRLTIQQTMAHKWFTVDHAGTPPDQALATKSRPAPLHGDDGASAKRRRTIGDGDGEVTMSVDAVLAPLGA